MKEHFLLIIQPLKTFKLLSEKSEYDLVIMAKDRGDPPLNSTSNVKILILDVNDNAPSFALSPFAKQWEQPQDDAQ